MALPLSQDLSTQASVGQAAQQRYSDYLRDKRALASQPDPMEGINQLASERFRSQIGPQGESGAFVDPMDLFTDVGTFKAGAVTPLQRQEALGKSLQTDLTALNLIQQMLPQNEALSPADQLAFFKEGAEYVDGKVVPKEGVEAGSVFLSPKEKVEKEASLRKEVRNELGDLDFKDVRANYDRIISTEPTPGGDLSMIFSYMKMLDPTSVVRETEQELAEKADSLPGQLRTYALKVSQGRKLNDSQRADFRRQAALVYNSQVKRAKDVSEYYIYEANRFGIDPKSVLGAAGEIKEVEIPESVAKQGGLMQMFGNILEGIPSSPLRMGDFGQDPLDQFYN